MEQTKIYPLNLPEADRKSMEFPNASGVPANLLPRSDFSAFEQIKWLLDSEGENLAGPDGLGLLANIGLIEGEPFEPDDEARAILDAAAKTAYKMSRVIGLSEEVHGQSCVAGLGATSPRLRRPGVEPAWAAEHSGPA